MPFGGPTAGLKCSRSLPYLPTYISTETGLLTPKNSLTKLFQWLGLRKSNNGRIRRKRKIFQIIERLLKKKGKKRRSQDSSNSKFICIPSLYLYERFPSGSSTKNRVFRRTTSDSSLNYKSTYEQPQATPECFYKVTLDGVQFNLDELFVECSKEEASSLKKSMLRNFKDTKMEIYEASGNSSLKPAKIVANHIGKKEQNQSDYEESRIEKDTPLRSRDVQIHEASGNSSLKPIKAVANHIGEKDQNQSSYEKSRLEKETPLRNREVTVQMVGDCLPDPTIRRFFQRPTKASYNLFQPLSGGKTPKQRSMLHPSRSSLKLENTKEHDKIRWVKDMESDYESIDEKEFIRVTNSLKGTIRGLVGREVSSARNQPEASKFALNEQDFSRYSKCCQMPSTAIVGDHDKNDFVGNANSRGNVKKTVKHALSKHRGEPPADSSPSCFELKKTTSQKTNLARMGSKLEISRLKKLEDFIRIHRIEYGKLEFKERLALQWVESKDSRKPLHDDLSPKTQENRPFQAVPAPSIKSRFVPHFPPNRKFVYENRTNGCCLQESREQFVEPKVVGSFSEETLPFDSLFVPVPTTRKAQSVKIRSNLWRFQNKEDPKRDGNLPIFKSIG